MINMADVDKKFAITKEKAFEMNRKKHQFHLIEDTIDEMEGWVCFKKDRKNNHGFLSKAQSENVKDPKRRNLAVVIEKIGRNDPCHCGSGKKYKKCCGL